MTERESKPFEIGDVVSYDFFGPRIGTVVGIRPVENLFTPGTEWWATVQGATGGPFDKRASTLTKLGIIDALSKLVSG